jgi:hypothetical protein
MPNGTLDGFNHILDFDEGLTDVFRVSAILFPRQSSRDVAAVRNLSISCCDQLLKVFVILSPSGDLLLINLFAQQLRQRGDVRRNPPRLIAVFATYASPTIAKPFGRYRKLLHLKSVATIVRLTARSAANQTVQTSHRSL